MTERMRKKLMHLYNPDLMGETDQVRGIYGEIPGIKPGARYETRKACADAGVHGVTYAGIHGSKKTGAYSVCLSGGYEDDADDGDFFIYTGTGGQRDSFAGDHEQVSDQTFKHDLNASLQVSYYLSQPVRVVRGEGLKSGWAPVKGYRYDGLYIIEKAYYDKGLSGFRVCMFEFRRKTGQPSLSSILDVGV